MLDVIAEVAVYTIAIYLIIGVGCAIIAWWAAGRHDTTVSPLHKVVTVLFIILFWCPTLFEMPRGGGHGPR